MSYLYRLVARSTYSLNYISRMNAHNLPPGASVKTSDGKSGDQTVSGSGQFIATDGPSASTKTTIGGGSGKSVLPGAQTAQNKTNSTKTAGDSKQPLGSNSPPDADHQSVLNSPLGQMGVLAVALVSIYAAYKILVRNAPDQRARFNDLQNQSDVHAKIAEEHNPKRSREATNSSLTTKAH